MRTMSAAELAASVRFSRPIRPDATTLFGIMRNEMYFLPSFLAHYRQLGVSQFLIVDDGSDDGSREYLLQQEDCCVGQSELRYGDRVAISDAAYGGLTGRVGPLLKRVLPDHYLRDRYVLVADADEFLILPKACPSLAAVVDTLKDRGWKSVSASLIDFYPQTLAELADETPPASADELFRRYGLFDAVAFMRIPPGRQPRKTALTASQRLFAACGIRQVPDALAFLPPALARLLPFPVPKAAWFKTPIVKYDGKTWMDGAHEANVPPPPDFMLAMAHFKFNGDTYRKIQSALRLRSHARKGQKYAHYEEMLDVMQRRNLPFAGPASVRYTSPEQLLEIGLMALPAGMRS